MGWGGKSRCGGQPGARLLRKPLGQELASQGATGSPRPAPATSSLGYFSESEPAGSAQLTPSGTREGPHSFQRNASSTSSHYFSESELVGTALPSSPGRSREVSATEPGLQEAADQSVLEKVFTDAQISRVLDKALEWCSCRGVATMEKLLEVLASFLADMDLRPLERSRLCRLLGAEDLSPKSSSSTSLPRVVSRGDSGGSGLLAPPSSGDAPRTPSPSATGWGRPRGGRGGFFSTGGRAQAKGRGRGYDPRGFVQGVEHASPECWAVTVGQISELWNEIKDDLKSYSQDHQLVRQWQHVCINEKCKHDHKDVDSVPKSSLRKEELDSLKPLDPNMHLVVQRYIKPKTFEAGCSYALMLNKGAQKANVFISHSWGHKFEDFVKTLELLDKEETVWVCSFALNQNSDISAELGSNVENSPFAKALKASDKVILVLDETAEPLTRSWCVYELYLATESSKRLDVKTHNYKLEVFHQLAQRVQDLDVCKCSASNPDDHDRIMKAIKSKEEDVNRKVKDIVRDKQKEIQQIWEQNRR